MGKQELEIHREEGALVERYKNEFPKSEAFTILWSWYEPQQLRALALLRCPTAVEDVLQDTWLKLHKKRTRELFDPTIGTGKSAWNNYAKRILQNVIIDRNRGRKPAPVGSEGLEELPDPRPQTAAVEIEDRETQARQVRDCIDRDARLTEHEREIVLGRFFRNLKGTALAEAQGVSNGTISKRQEKALEKLKQCIEAKGIFGGQR